MTDDIEGKGYGRADFVKDMDDMSTICLRVCEYATSFDEATFTRAANDLMYQMAIVTSIGLCTDDARSVREGSKEADMALKEMLMDMLEEKKRRDSE